MEIGITVGCILLVGGLYELFRKKRSNNFDNRNFITFHDNLGNRHILRLDLSILNKNNSQEIIDKNTKEYIALTDLGICTISQEQINSGTSVRELNCGHYFQKEYIDIWLSENNVCPMCRKNFKIASDLSVKP
jgi:hypothetical protein